MHLYLGERVEPRSLVIHERTDSFAIRRLNGQCDSVRLSAIECGERSIEDQPLEQLRREDLRGNGPAEMRTADDQKPLFCSLTRELPHGASKQVLEPPDQVLPVDPCTVIRLQRNEVARRNDAGQRQDVKAAGRGYAVDVERRPRAIIDSANLSMYDQCSSSSAWSSRSSAVSTASRLYTKKSTAAEA